MYETNEFQYLVPKGMPKVETLQLTRLPGCGHKLVPGQEPRHANCGACWFAFFRLHTEITETAARVVELHALPGLAQIKGRKFAKHFERYQIVMDAFNTIVEVQKSAAQV